MTTIPNYRYLLNALTIQFLFFRKFKLNYFIIRLKSLTFMGNIIELNKSKRKNHERFKDVHQR